MYYKARERRSDLTGNAGHSRSSDPGPYPGQGHCAIVLCFGKTYSTSLHSLVRPTVPLSTQVHKWALVNLILEGKPVMD